MRHPAAYPGGRLVRDERARPARADAGSAPDRVVCAVAPQGASPPGEGGGRPRLTPGEMSESCRSPGSVGGMTAARRSALLVSRRDGCVGELAPLAEPPQ